MPESLEDSWLRFLLDIESALAAEARVHCLGGFAIAAQFGLTRTTGDLDLIEVPAKTATELLEIAGKGTPLAKRHRMYIDIVAVGFPPHNYSDRLIKLNLPGLVKLQLFLFEKHDIVLSKLSRAIERDWEDVKYLAANAGLDVEVLRQRFRDELREFCTNPRREELTLDLWIEEIEKLSPPTP